MIYWSKNLRFSPFSAPQFHFTPPHGVFPCDLGTKFDLKKLESWSRI